MAKKEFAISTAKQFVADCAAHGLYFEKVYLFGSYVHGNAHEWSDIDLLLVSKQFTQDVFENLKLYSKVNIKYPIIETHTYPITYFKNGDAFIADVLKDAIEIN
jgi:uncharacterized protein